jgi:hypothetical protein
VVINLKTARALGLTNPALAAAAAGSGDRVIGRRTFVAAMAAQMASPLVGEAQQAPKRWRVGYLSASFANPGGPGGWEAFRNALRDLGYVEGQNLILDGRFGEGRMESIPRLAAEIVGLGWSSEAPRHKRSKTPQGQFLSSWWSSLIL